MRDDRRRDHLLTQDGFFNVKKDRNDVPAEITLYCSGVARLGATTANVGISLRFGECILASVTHISSGRRVFIDSYRGQRSAVRRVDCIRIGGDIGIDLFCQIAVSACSRFQRASGEGFFINHARRKYIPGTAAVGHYHRAIADQMIWHIIVMIGDIFAGRKLMIERRGVGLRRTEAVMK